MRTRAYFCLCGIALALSISSCQLRLTRAQSSAEKHGFIAEDIENNSDFLPFELVHLSPDYAAKRAEYKKLYIAPLNVDIPLEKNKLNKEELEKLNKARQDYNLRLTKEIQKKSKGRITVVNAPSKDALTLEMYVLGATKNNVVLNVAAFLVPIPCSSQLAHTVLQGRVEMAARVLDPKTGKPIAEILDRDAGSYAAYSVKDYKRYGHTKEAFDNWVVIFGRMFASPKAEKVTAPPPVTLKPV